MSADHDVVPHLGGDVGRQAAQAVRFTEAVEAAYDGALRVQLDDLVVPGVRDQHATAGSGTALAGKRRSVGSTGGATYGESPGCSVPRSRCSATSSASSASIAWAWPSPAYCATTYPSGSISTSVGQARAV